MFQYSPTLWGPVGKLPTFFTFFPRFGEGLPGKLPLALSCPEHLSKISLSISAPTVAPSKHMRPAVPPSGVEWDFGLYCNRRTSNSVVSWNSLYMVPGKSQPHSLVPKEKGCHEKRAGEFIEMHQLRSLCGDRWSTPWWRARSLLSALAQSAYCSSVLGPFTYTQGCAA